MERSSVEACLELLSHMIAVADAVAYAHRCAPDLREREGNSLGGCIGMHPVDVAVWRMYRLGENSAEKLIIEQRLGEAKELDNGFSRFINPQDPTLRLIFDYLLVDKLTHVGKATAGSITCWTEIPYGSALQRSPPTRRSSRQNSAGSP